MNLGTSLLTPGGGGSGGGGGGDAFTSFKYDWKVKGGDATKQGRVKRDRDGNKVTVQFQNVVEGERAVRYQVHGPSQPHLETSHDRTPVAPALRFLLRRKPNVF